MLLAMLCCAITISAFAQNNEEETIKKTINQLFDGMRKADSSLVKQAFNEGAIL